MTILCLLVMTSLLSAQQPAADPRAEAERLARTGAYAEALERFEALAAANPDDLDVRIWIGRMMQRLGYPERAAAVFRSVIAVKPDNSQALVGLGGALAQMDQPDEAIEQLASAEKLAPDDPDLLAAKGAAHLAAGHVKLGLGYYRRAAELRPADPAIREAESDARRRYGHFVNATGFFESFSADVPETWSGSIELNGRAADQLRLFGRAQFQEKFSETEWRGGGGLEWNLNRRVAFRGAALFGGDARVLPKVDASGEAAYTRQQFTLAGGVQYVSFEPGFVGLETASAWFITPTLTVRVNDGFTVFARYTHSTSEFDESAASVGNDSGALGARFRLWPQGWIGVAWAGGVEDFDTLSIDRLGDFNANTLKGDLRIDLASLTSIFGAYEYQWREADQSMMRATFGLVQRFSDLVAAPDIVHNGVELGLLVAGLLAAAVLAVAAGVWWARAWRARRAARLAARYQPLVDELLTPASAGVAMAELLRAPASHRFAIGTLLLTLLRVTSGEAIEYARALTVSLGLRDAWRRQLGSRWAARRADAAHALGIVHDPTAADALIDLLNDPSPSVRAAAVGALGATADPKALPALLAAMDDPARFARSTIVEALGAMGEAAAPALLDHARKRPAQAAIVIELAGGIGGPAIAGQLLPWVADPRPEIRAAAIGGLGAAGLDERTYYYALRALEDGSGVVRAAAARAVGRAGREDAVPYLQAHLADEPGVAAECEAALRRLGGRSS